MTKSQLAKELLDKFPKASIRSLSKKLYAENNILFNSEEAARSALRYHTGSDGIEKRETALDKTHFDRKFSIPKSEKEDWKPFILSAKKILVLSDIHLPYHDEKALELAIDYGLKEGCETLLLNGDLMDFYGLSRFEKDPKKRSFSYELDMGRNFLKECSTYFKTYYKLGNHEERYQKFLFLKAPELLDISDFEFKTLFRCAENNITVIEDKRIIQAGKLNILHGHEFMGGGSGGVNPSRALFLKAMESCMEGHFHRSSEHTEPTMNGKVTTTWSTGCLCDLHPEYARLNKWNHGMAKVEFEGDNFHVTNKRIYQNKIL